MRRRHPRGRRSPRRLAARVAGQPDLSAWLAARPPQARFSQSPTYQALEHGSTQLVELTQELSRAAALDDQDLAAMTRLPARWWITVPLRTDERTHGLLQL